MADYDSPWKEALDVYFQAFLALFFPVIHNDINWARGFESLDKELQKITPRAAHGRRYVDKLVKVWRKNGRAVWVLIHIEVQTQRERGFARRMYTYNYRITDHYGRTAVSLAVLADDDPNWRPSSYQDALWGWSVRMTFPALKLLDYGDCVAELDSSANPFAHVVLAHLKALETRRDPEGRRAWKFRLVRGLYERGFKAEDVRRLFRLIDWLMVLPPAFEKVFWHEIDEYQEKERMPFITSVERIGIRKGLLQAIESALRIRFGEAATKLMAGLEEVWEADKLHALHEAILKAGDLDEVHRAVAEATAPSEPSKKPSRRKKK